MDTLTILRRDEKMKYASWERGESEAKNEKFEISEKKLHQGFECDLCLRRFYSKFTMERHKTNIHEKRNETDNVDNEKMWSDLMEILGNDPGKWSYSGHLVVPEWSYSGHSVGPGN